MSVAKYLRTPLFLSVALLSQTGLAQDAMRDELVLKDGSRVFGVVSGARDGAVTVTTEFAGDITIPLDQVQNLKSSAPATLLLQDDSVLRNQPLVIQDQRIIASGSADGYAVDQLQTLNPEPWELGQGYKWTGLANFALELERGNSEKDQLDYKFASLWQGKRDRISFEWRGEQDETDGDKTADNWTAIAGYDYLVADPYYVGVEARAEEDEFADLDLRYLIGPYIGRQFFNGPELTLDAQVGLAYGNDNYIVAEDTDYLAGTWSIDISSNYLGGKSRLYFDQDGVLNFDEASNVVVDTAIGIAFPLMWNLEGAAEVLLEYDGSAEGDIDELDETYRIRVGYNW